MKQGEEGSAFDHLPRTARGDFALLFYAAVYRVIDYACRMAEQSGDTLAGVLAEYPFLDRYLSEMRLHMPASIGWDEGSAWWERELALWGEGAGEHLPLRALAASERMGLRSCVALMVAGLVEEDSRFGTLFTFLQAPLPYRRPSLELIACVMADGASLTDVDPWRPYQPLCVAGYLEAMNADAPRSEWALRVPSVLWDAVRGELDAIPVPWAGVEPRESLTDLNDMILPDGIAERLRQLPLLIASGKTDAVILRASQGSERRRVMGGIAKMLGRSVITVNGAALATAKDAACLGPLCTLTGSIPVLIYDAGPGETVELPNLVGYRGLLGVLMGKEGGLRGAAAERGVTVVIPSPKSDERMRHWEAALGGHPVEDLRAVSERFHLPAGYIGRAATMAIAHAALQRRESITTTDVRDACRSLNRQLLDTLATRLPVEGRWDRLVVSEATGLKLAELDRRCRHRERLLDYLGPAFGGASNRGVRALFSGPSGTGKTLAAKILASELGMDLYRVDLAAVVNKYIGETEKNLNQVLTVAEELDVILLLDEGDALLGSRTEVKSSNDRYANLETNYLLQRLEHYEGIVVVTTNAGENIDRAFQRRMDVVVDFIPAGPAERHQIWQAHLPNDHRVDPLFLESVALRCALGGGQIRNAALHATLMALDGGGRVTSRHLLDAVESEYRKAGAVSPLSEEARSPRRSNGMQSFIDSLSSSEAR